MRRGDKHSPLTFLEVKAVQPTTHAAYLQRFEEVMAFAEKEGLQLRGSTAELDLALTEFVTYRYFGGYDSSDGRKIHAAVCHVLQS